MAKGIVVAGTVVPNTEWCIRDPSAWWHPGERGTKPRAPEINLIVGHWSGGEGARDHDKHGRTVVQRMKARRRKDGTLMSVAIHFVVGACEREDLYAPVWQTADFGLTATIHASKAVNARAIGVEVVNAGLPGPLDLRSRNQIYVPLLGRKRPVLDFFDGQIRSWTRLCDALTTIANTKIRVPRHVPMFDGELAKRRFTVKEQRRWKGVQEHLHCTPATKLDAGGLLVAALRAEGWDAVAP